MCLVTGGDDGVIVHAEDKKQKRSKAKPKTVGISQITSLEMKKKKKT